MGDAQRNVIFDPFVLADAVSKGSDTVEYEALEVLRQNCPNHLVINDEEGRLGRAYDEELRGRFTFVQEQILDTLQSEEKVVSSTKTYGVSSLELPRGSHVIFARAALALRPTYLVTRIPKLLSVAEKLPLEFGTLILSAEDYIRREKLIP